MDQRTEGYIPYYSKQGGGNLIARQIHNQGQRSMDNRNAFFVHQIYFHRLTAGGRRGDGAEEIPGKGIDQTLVKALCFPQKSEIAAHSYCFRTKHHANHSPAAQQKNNMALGRMVEYQSKIRTGKYHPVGQHSHQ